MIRSSDIARTLALALLLGVGLLQPRAAAGQSRDRNSAALETTVPPGDNYDQASFRLWTPKSAEPLVAVLVLMPGSNSDGRPEVEDSVWQRFATQHHLALLGCYFTDKPHDQDFIEEYAAVARGSGDALLKGLRTLAKQSGHAELADAPLLLWGMSAGGEFNYEFAAWRPERVAAFIVNKGGIYYSALVSQAARNVPGLFFVGGKDLAFRTNTILGLFTVNRRAGALWALAEESDIGHEVGRSRDMAITFFDEVLSLRVSDAARGKPRAPMKTLTTGAGFIGNFETKTFEAANDGDAPGYPTAWLPGPRTARAWQALVTGKPFEP